MSSGHRPHSTVFVPTISFVLTLASITSFAGAQIPHSQCSALLLLKKGFSFKPSLLPSWRPGTECCGWDGVRCDKESGLVTDLDLSNRFIAGNITDALFDLTSLQRLNLAYNLFDLSPLTQSGFEKLGDLTYLNLSNSGLIGQVPIGICLLKKLATLDLSILSFGSARLKLENPDLGTIISGLSNLKELYLDGVDLSKNGKEWCEAISSSLPGLRALSLEGCLLSGPINESLTKLRHLSVIQLGQNNFSSEVPEFFSKFSSLSVLRLTDCQLRGLFPSSVFRLKNLAVLDLNGNPMLTGYLPETLGNLRSLTKLDLMGCHFSGPIPPSIGNLTRLLHLDLSLNGFTGVLPPALGGPMISHIILAHNSLTGPIPTSLGTARLGNLVMLNLRNNSLSGPVPSSLFTFPALQHLDLSQNKLSGQLEEFSKASSLLYTVELSGNMLNGEIPKSMFELSGLRVLALASNNFNGIVELGRLSSMRNLSTLDLSENKLTVLDANGNSSHPFPLLTNLRLASCNMTTIPGFLRNGDFMSSLDLSNNRIGGVIPKWIWSIGNMNLIHLNLSHNLFTGFDGPLPDLFMSQLLELDLHSNLLQGPIPLPSPYTVILDYSNNLFISSIPPNMSYYLNYTIFFSLSSNHLTGEVPPSMCSAPFLQVLDLSDNFLNGTVPACFMDGGLELRVLNLGRNQFRGTVPQNISKQCALQTINLNGNQLEGQLPRSLSHCSMLEVLDLGNNQLVGTFPFWLGRLPTLRILVLRSNQFRGHLKYPSGSYWNNSSFSMLQIFDISSNKFIGRLPSELFKNLRATMANRNAWSPSIGLEYLVLSHSYYHDRVSVTTKGQELALVKIVSDFTYIDISKNKFEGSIPQVIGDLKSLHALNMSHNSLTGPLPSSLGNMVQLESLDLSWNQLSGEIPTSLTSITFLASLNLSYNKLVGRVPQNGQFSTFSNESFEGNDGLCESPLTKQCSVQSLEPSLVSEDAAASMTDVDVVLLWLFAGMGYGVGFALVIGLQLVLDKRVVRDIRLFTRICMRCR